MSVIDFFWMGVFAFACGGFVYSIFGPMDYPYLGRKEDE